jgi:molybdopterin molybdotransferase
VLVTTGGASVGDHDHTEDALRALGGELVFHRVAIRPGKPVLFGTTARGQLVFGMPGNPAAATLGFELFVRLALRLLQGDPQPARPVFQARLAAPIKAVPGLTYFPRGRLSTALEFTPFGQQSSMQIGSWARANAIARIPPGDARLDAGASVEVLLTGSFG